MYMSFTAPCDYLKYERLNQLIYGCDLLIQY